jgi:glucose-6-phosphate isomerase
MPTEKLSSIKEWRLLENHADEMGKPDHHLSFLLDDDARLKKFSIAGGGLWYDYSRQRIKSKTMGLLYALAEKRCVVAKFSDMISGDTVNTTEKRAALHTASRDFTTHTIMVDGINVMPGIIEQREQIRDFSDKIRKGTITGSSGKPFNAVVVIGIGGSYLGTEFVAAALHAFSGGQIKLYFLSNVDIHNFGAVVSQIEPDKTLWVVISKSYTTAETLANTRQVYEYLASHNIDPSKQVVTVTAKGSPGDNPSNPVLRSFYMFDFIGGRYSVTSAVGGVPISLLTGYPVFERFLKGAEEMDRHCTNAPLRENLPLTAALISIWNNNFLHYPAQAIIPYAAPLSRLAPHIQQLNMESNGKSVYADGDPIEVATGTIVFGEPGTNAQHSFFQLAHQGRAFPIDFIGVLNPQYNAYNSRSKGVSNHQELWANIISQPASLAMGKPDENKAQSFSGNRPSSTLVLNDLSPENVGRLLSFYEAKTVYEAFVWGINPFDQFGVELGKSMAAGVRNEMAARNSAQKDAFSRVDDISRHYINMLFNGSISSII